MKIITITLSITLALLVGCKNMPTPKNAFQNDSISLHQEGINKEGNDSYPTEFDQSSAKCNINTVLHTIEHIDTLSLDEITMFLRTFSKDCENNVEFSEFSNEVLFKVLEKQPDLLIAALCLKDEKTEYSEIYEELSSPIHDLIPLERINQSIKSITNDCSQLDSIKKYVRVAYEKY